MGNIKLKFRQYFHLKDEHHRLAATGVAALIFISGLLTFARPLAERLPDKLTDALQLLDEANASLLLTGFGLALMYLAFELLQRKRLAWWLTLLLLIANLVLHGLIGGELYSGFISAAALGVLLTTRRYFTSKIHTENIKQGISLLAISVGIAIGYGVLGFWFLDRRDFGLTFTFGQAVSRTMRSYLLVGNNDLQSHTLYGRWFIHSLAIVGAISLAYGLFCFFRPVRYRFRTLPHDRASAAELLEKYGGETDDFFKLWPLDKSYFFSSDKQAFVAYGVSNGVALCFSGPAGSPKSVAKLLEEFKSFCLDNGWLIAFAQSSGRFDKQLKAADFNRLPIGADAVINIDHFLETTVRNKYFRNIVNRFEKQKYTTEFHEPPHSHQLFKEFRSVSVSWLNRAGRKQWRFFTGYFSHSYMQQVPMFIVRDQQGKMQAFANLIPSYKKGEGTVDLMRHRKNSPNNLMDFLFIELFRKLKAEGYTTFNLGLSAVAAKDFADTKSVKVLANIFTANQSVIAFQGLHRFKNKYDPEWEARYVYYQGSAGRLPQVGLAAAQLMKY